MDPLADNLTRRAALGTLAVLTACATRPASGSIATADAVLTTPEGRAVSYRAAWPRGRRGPLGLVLLSHGANGTLDGLANLIEAFAADRIVAAPLHVDGEGHPQFGKTDRSAVTSLRLADMRLLLDNIGAIERLSATRIDRARIAAAGHSYGGLIAQALGGAEIGMPGEPMRSHRDPRVRAVAAFSPPGPIAGYFGRDGWAKLAVPMFVQTGTADVLPMIAPTWEAHAMAYEASAVPGSVLWAGHGVDHYFGNLIQRPTRQAPDQRVHFDAAMAIARAFLDARLDDDRGAVRWLAGGGPRERYTALTARYEVK